MIQKINKNREREKGKYIEIYELRGRSRGNSERKREIGKIEKGQGEDKGKIAGQIWLEEKEDRNNREIEIARMKERKRRRGKR